MSYLLPGQGHGGTQISSKKRLILNTIPGSLKTKADNERGLIDNQPRAWLRVDEK
jgi:hypothetical protein